MDVGARLRLARESRGLTREALSRSTRIPAATLAAIEHNDIASLPPFPYNKGFVEVYAREVALDPHATAREFLDQFEPPADVPPEPHVSPDAFIEGPSARVAWLLVPILGLVLVIYVSRPSTPGTNTAGDPADSARSGEVATSADTGPPAERAVLAIIPEPVSIVLKTSGAAWVDARADGRRVLYELLAPGMERRLSADREIVLRVGDAGAVSLVVNDRRLGVVGRPGEVRILRVTPDGVR